MKRPPLPKASKAELKQEAFSLLQRRMYPIEAVNWLLDRFNGWDLEAIIEELNKGETK